MLSPNVRELAFERSDGESLSFDAGQWMSLVLPLASGEVRRSYSIASPPAATSSCFEIAVTHVRGGPGSTYLHELPIGTTVRTIGPQGFFTRGKGKGHPALFVATGTGVTPLRSMLKDAVLSRTSEPMWLIFGVRHASDMLYKDEFATLCEGHPNVRVEFTLSQPPPDWTGRKGYVQTHVRGLFDELARVGPPHAYICGLQRMVGSVRDLLRKEMNVPREQVHSERYD